MTRDELIAAVENAIGALSSVYRSSADESDIYEAGLLTLAVDAARLAGGTELLTNDARRPASEITLRRGPGNPWTPGYTYAQLTFPNRRRLEVHLGVMVAGKSGVAHECDVAQSSASLGTLIARKTPESFPETEPGSSAGDRLTRHVEQQIRNWLA